MFQLGVQLNLVIAYLLLIPFILLNVLLALARFFAGRLASFTRKYLKIEIPYETARDRTFNIIFTLCWLIVGVYATLQLDNPITLGGFMVFLSFRSGSTTGRRVIYGFHDSKMINSLNGEKQLHNVVATAFKIGLIVEGIFLLTWSILYKALSLSIKTAFGIDVNILIILLWLAGLVFGIAFGILRSKTARGFLLKDEIIIVLLFSGKLLEEKVKATIGERFIPKI
ncbi:MAG: hypothetical protein ACP6IS_03790 [Candidatus Asgardarchaeia archaeon]